MVRALLKKPANQEVVDNSLNELGKRLDVYDQILSKQKYVAGDVSSFRYPILKQTFINSSQQITLADFYHIPYGELLAVAGSNIMETRPNVAK